MNKNAVMVMLLICMAPHNSGVHAEPGLTISTLDEGVSTELLLQNMRGLINDAIAAPRISDNYRLFKTATELKSIIDTWEKANSTLGDKTLQGLDKSQRQFFETAVSVAGKLDQDSVGQKEAASLVADLQNQAVEDAGIFGGKLALFQYSPRIAYPGMSKNIAFTLRGYNFDLYNPRITLPSGDSAPRLSLSNRQAVFSVPLTAFKFEAVKTGALKLRLTYLNSNKKPEKTDITVLRLPLKHSDFTLQIRTKDSVRDIWEGKRQFYWSGRELSRTLSQGPHGHGWRIDVSSLRQDWV